MAVLFTDTFNRTAGGLGENWIQATIWDTVPINSNPYYGNFSIAAITGGINGLKVGYFGGAGSLGVSSAFPTAIVPVPTFLPLYRFGSISNRGVAQYAKIRMVHRALPGGGIGWNGGVGAFLSAGQGGLTTGRLSGYFFITDELGHAELVRYIDSFLNVVQTVILINVAGGAANQVNDGDTIEIRCTPSVSSNFIEIFINGVSVGSTTDSDPSRPFYGTVCVFTYCGFATAPGLAQTGEFNAFEAGTL